ncbi:hypothetical protein M758_1G046000 [Ceratodon purpureus]|uniref:Uncharacterized protein n=1 Tax=Ceratodon purpureus TaxID=3225 RepID=A0A8T0J2H9_CERPU|nr:hypothetical protein KC19_1G048600 [Ceratodon purpureus]KAG0628698.1 hypothetical protein M758_1G046000 [Ceratodon purpureus]
MSLNKVLTNSKVLNSDREATNLQTPPLNSNSHKSLPRYEKPMRQAIRACGKVIKIPQRRPSLKPFFTSASAKALHATPMTAAVSRNKPLHHETNHRIAYNSEPYVGRSSQRGNTQHAGITCSDQLQYHDQQELLLEMRTPYVYAKIC